MNYQEILAPVDDYKNNLREAHAKNTVEAFDALLQESGVDEQTNIELVKVVRKLEEMVNSLKSKLGVATFFRGLFILIAVVCTIGLVLYFLDIFKVVDSSIIPREWILYSAPGAVVSYVIIFAWLNPVIKRLRAALASNQEALDKALAAAWEQMQPLNRLFQWDTIAKIITKTMPILKLDSFFSQERMDQLVGHFGLVGIDFPNQSVLCCQSGALNGNPLLLAETFNQYWGSTTYHGSLEITWEEYDRDAKRTVTHSQTLHASVTKPSPDYTKEKFIIYGNEAAPDLEFSREPNSYSDKDSFFDKRTLNKKIKELEKMSRDLSTEFTIMDNQEFDASFYAINRTNEHQFRLLYTPLAQQETLKLLRDKEVGFGDDFTFRKSNMINVVLPKHMDNIDISGSPSLFRNYELAVVRQRFIDYSNNFFHSFFFGLAPLLCVPLYQQHRSTLDIFKSVYERGVSFYEYESLANAWSSQCFTPEGAVTPSILKTKLLERNQDHSRIAVTAHAFRGYDRVEYVRVYGDDGRWHNVPVEWIEYLPVTRTREMAVRAVPGDDGKQAQDQIFTEEWQEYFRSCGVNYSNIQLRRNLVSYFRS